MHAVHIILAVQARVNTCSMHVLNVRMHAACVKFGQAGAKSAFCQSTGKNLKILPEARHIYVKKILKLKASGRIVLTFGSTKPSHCIAKLHLHRAPVIIKSKMEFAKFSRYYFVMRNLIYFLLTFSALINS